MPFSVNDISTSPLANATLMELDTDGTYSDKQTGLDGTTLYLYFKDATEIEAGKPYIIKWEGTYMGDPIENPVFSGVTIDSNASTEVSFTGGKFVGTYSPIEWDTENQSILFLGDNNSLYWPKPEGENNPGVNAFRAYFDLGTYTVRQFVLNFDGESTGVTTTNHTNFTNGSDEWYTLDGRKLSGKPTKKVMYINGGRKTVIK